MMIVLKPKKRSHSHALPSCGLPAVLVVQLRRSRSYCRTILNKEAAPLLITTLPSSSINSIISLYLLLLSIPTFIEILSNLPLLHSLLYLHCLLAHHDAGLSPSDAMSGPGHRTDSDSDSDICPLDHEIEYMLRCAYSR